MGLWNLTFPSYGALKGGHTFLFSTEQVFCQKRLYHIVAMIVLNRFRIVRHCCAALFSIKTLFCKINNIFYSLENQIWDKTKQWFWKYIKNKGKVTLESFRNFACATCYKKVWHGNEITKYLKNYKCHRFYEGHSKKLL